MDRFWSKVDKTGDCWEWTGAKHSSKGYGSFWFEGRSVKAHRLAYKIAFSPIPDGMFVCHSCDNPSCVNPDHLFLGTNQDNQSDMYAKGRGRKCVGSESPHSKLTEDDIKAIRTEPKVRGYGVKLASQYGVSTALISQIIKGAAWSHIS